MKNSKPLIKTVSVQKDQLLAQIEQERRQMYALYQREPTIAAQNLQEKSCALDHLLVAYLRLEQGDC